jgi:hypothetical protein
MQRRFLLASSSSAFFFPRRPFLGGGGAAKLSCACVFASPAASILALAIVVARRLWGFRWRGATGVSGPSLSQRSINQQRASAVCRTVGRGSALVELSTWRATGSERDRHLTQAGTWRESCGSECYLPLRDWARHWLICERYYTLGMPGCGYVEGCRPSWICDSRLGAFLHGPHCGDVDGGSGLVGPTFPTAVALPRCNMTLTSCN